MNNKKIVIFLAILSPILLLTLLELLEREYQAKLNTVNVFHEAIEIGDGARSYLLYRALEMGKVELVKASLLKEYEEEKARANHIQLETYQNDIWPYKVDENSLKMLKDNIETINDRK